MIVARTRALPSFAAGLRGAASRPRLVIAIWAWQLLVAAAASLPLFRAINAAASQSPATDRLLDRFSLSLFTELQQYNVLPIGQMVQMSAAGAVLVSLAVAPLLLAAVITALETTGRPSLAELGAAAGRWYWPLLRLFVFGRLIGLTVGGLVAAGLFTTFLPVRHSLWEAGRLASGPVAVGIALAVAALFFAATDYGMIHAMRAGAPRMFAAWRMGMRAAFTRPLTTLGLWILFALSIAGLAALLFAVLGTFGGASKLAILAAFVVQQLFVIFRIGVRVALVGAEATTWRVQPDPVVVAPELPDSEPVLEASPGTA